MLFMNVLETLKCSSGQLFLHVLSVYEEECHDSPNLWFDLDFSALTAVQIFLKCLFKDKGLFSNNSLTLSLWVFAGSS